LNGYNKYLEKKYNSSTNNNTIKYKELKNFHKNILYVFYIDYSASSSHLICLLKNKNYVYFYKGNCPNYGPYTGLRAAKSLDLLLKNNLCSSERKNFWFFQKHGRHRCIYLNTIHADDTDSEDEIKID
jgi:hypothetical protein